jgi:hypothetical protein
MLGLIVVLVGIIGLSLPLGSKIAAVQVGNEIKGQTFTHFADDIRVTSDARMVDLVGLNDLRLINYFPSNHGWGSMWTTWDPAGMAQDFAAIKGLGANAVRIIVQPVTFGYPEPSSEMLGRLREAVRLADTAHLKAWVTLFDLWAEYGDIAGSDWWMDRVVTPFSGDPRVAAFELRNEMPSTPPALAWAHHSLQRLRLVGARPTTISMSGGIDGLKALRDKVADSPPTFYSVHVYQSDQGEKAYAFLKRAKAVLAEPGPSGVVPGIFVGEFGRTSRPAPGQTPAEGEADQDVLYRAVFAATAELRLPAPAPWTLSDFTSSGIPSQLRVASNPNEYQMGLYRLDGTLKPAGKTTHRFFTQKPVTCGFNQGFEVGSGPRPLLWRTWARDQGTFFWDTSVAHTGRGSVRISSSTSSPLAVPAWYIAPPCGALRLGPEVLLSAWVRGQDTSGLQRVTLAFFREDGAYLGQQESLPAPIGTFDWRPLRVIAQVPVGAAYLQIHLKSDRNLGTVWFDDVTLEPSGGDLVLTTR